MKEQLMVGGFHGLPDGKKRDDDGMIIQQEEISNDDA